MTKSPKLDWLVATIRLQFEKLLRKNAGGVYHKLTDHRQRIGGKFLYVAILP